MNFFKYLLILIFISTSLCSVENQVDSISFIKIKKLVKKEEQIAKAYKEYIRNEGKSASLETLLLDDKKYLPEGFSSFNLFGKKIEIDTDKNEIKNTLIRKKVDDKEIVFDLKPNVYDYYYSNKYRENTRAPINIKNRNISINLDDNEKYILKYKALITKDKSQAINKFYLDSKGLLHWHDNENKYQYTLAKDLILDKSIEIFDGKEIKESFTNLFAGKDILYAGQTLFHPSKDDEDIIDEYLHLGNGNGIIKIGKEERDIGETILQFTRRSGGMIVNGDLYTWGNNENKIVAIGKNNYINKENKTGKGKALITTLVRAKAKTYDSAIDDKNYFSSPLRPKFIDFTSDVWHSTCAVTTKGVLYCSGTNTLESNPISFDGYTKGSYKDLEYLYRSTYFNGIDNKALKVFPLNSTYMVLGKPANDTEDGYFMHYWGSNNNNGWGGSGKKNDGKKITPYKTSDIRFLDITFTLTIGYRRIGGLSTDGDIYTWGFDSFTVSSKKCEQNGEVKNVCKPEKVKTNIKFTSILGGQQNFLATDKDGKYYRISQEKGKAAKVEDVNKLIEKHDDYDSTRDSEIIAIDITSKLINNNIKKYDSYGKGIVWINSYNELKGDYFTGENKTDKFFIQAIKKIKWKKIRMVEDKNGMCGIDIYNQMYCWGAMSFYAGSNAAGNTFMLPVFNSNLHDLDKDYLVAAAGNADGKKSNVTNMTSGEWARGDKGEFFMKYPTYIGGFNYEFIFK